MYGFASCSKGTALGDIANWNARMYGDLAVTYTTGKCSFGANGNKTSRMGKSKFVLPGTKLTSYTKHQTALASYSSVSTTLYY